MLSPRRLSVGGWLGVGFGAAAALLLAVTGLSLVLLSRLGAHEHREAIVVVPRTAAAERLESAVLSLGIAVRTYALTPDPQHLRDYESASRRARTALERLAAFPRDADGEAIFARIVASAPAHEDAVRALARSAREGADTRAAEVRLTAAREALLVPVREYVALQHRMSADASAAVLALERRTRRVLVLAAALVLALVAATAVVAARNVRRPAKALVQAARQLAAGDYGPAAALAGPPDAPPTARNELVELTRAFGRMGLALQDREERLSAQNEELQAQNEELHAQQEEIQVQQEELQAQNEELQTQNEELRVRDARLRGALERIATSEERYRQLFTNVSEGFALHELVCDASGTPVDYRFLEVNPAFERITGLDRERTVGRTLREVLPDAEPEWLERYARVATSGEPMRFESYARALGKHFEVVAFSPRRGQFAAIFFDVSDRKRIEEALREADQRKNEFLAVLSHELRNPLAPIVNSLALLDRPGARAEQARRARVVISRQVAHLARLVDDLLDVTRISRGKIHLRRTRVELRALVRQATEDNASVLADHGVELAVDVAREPLWLDADPARLSQVVGNLLRNAAKFTAPGGRVSVTVAGPDGGGRASVVVRDSGIGMAPEVVAKLFEPFMQAERSLARTRGGLGLGLALVKGLVELHGGTVRAASAGEGCGSEFVVDLPAEGDAAGALEVPAAAAMGGRRVLIIEDNADAAESLRDVLELSGHVVAVAFDGAEGLRRARAFRPDSVVCDVGLPGMSGYDVARHLRADPDLRGALLVALTGYALPDDVRLAEEAGFDAHLAKPATPEALARILSGAPSGKG